jgi:hypothetical protein
MAITFLQPYLYEECKQEFLDKILIFNLTYWRALGRLIFISLDTRNVSGSLSEMEVWPLESLY